MAARRWTVMVIPHGSDSPRSYSVSDRMLRGGAYAGSVVLLVVMMGFGYAIAGVRSIASPTSLATAHPAGTSELTAVASRVALLRDTIAVIREREQHIRLLAGLPSADSVVEVDATGPRPGPTITSAGLAVTPTAVLGADVDTLLARAHSLAGRFAAVSDSLATNRRRFESLPSLMPTAGWLTSHFSRARRHPLLHGTRRHDGIDVSAAMGTPIIAPAAGVVRSTGRENGYGLMIEIDHGNGIMTRYAHASRIDVRTGQRVARGERIGAVGNTGLSTGPHLHYEIHINGKAVDPLTYVLPDVIPD
jgi:murein DD-endopeptidase MepM/ murein hydrolase activator NlpD